MEVGFAVGTDVEAALLFAAARLALLGFAPALGLASRPGAG